ncbi:MAG: MFS transporter [Caldilineaceae bacterium]|nr:MFS transporter [Caldilineaceae bacterium]
MSRRPLTAILLVSLGHLSLEVFHQYLPVIYPLLRDKFDLSFAQLGAVALVATTASSIAQPFFGYFTDRWDARRVVAFSVLWLGLVMGLVGLANSYGLLLGIVALASLGSAAFHPAGAAVVSKATQGLKGLAVSFFSVGGNLGSAVSPLLMAAGLAAFGLSGTAVLVPLALLAGGLLYFGLGREDAGEQARHRQSQADAGQGFVAGLVLLTLAVMTRSWFQMSLTSYLPVWLEGQGRSVADAAQMLFLLSVCIGLGSLAGGTLSDRVGCWQVLIVCLALLSPLYWLYLNSNGGVQAGFLAGIGFCLGCTFPTAVVLAQEVWPRGLALASGLVMGLGWWPGGLGASVTGLLADRIGLDAALSWLLVAPVLGALCMAAFVVAQRQTVPVRSRE